MKNTSSTPFGTTDDKGHWKPPYACEYPLFSGGLTPKKLLRFFFVWGGYLWPRNLFYAALAFATYFLFRADIEAVAVSGFSAAIILLMLARNVVLTLVIYGGYQLLLYTFRVQGNKGKYHPEWKSKGKKFLFGSQLADNVLRTLLVGVTVWTAYEVLYIWLYSIGFLPVITFASSPVLFVAQFLFIPLIRETHFYFVHKLLHTKWLMRRVHRVHHMNISPAPWSGLAMHPIEMVLYFSVVLFSFVIPSHPIHFFFNIQLTALTPAQGHSGFEGPFLKGALPTGDYFHYLHHKYVSCNFGGTTLPWDKTLGIHFNGDNKFHRIPVKMVDTNWRKK